MLLPGAQLLGSLARVHRRIAVEGEALPVQAAGHQSQQDGGGADPGSHRDAQAVGGGHDLGAGVGDGGAAGLGNQSDFTALTGALQPGLDLSIVCLVAQRMDRDFLQRTLGADQLQEGAGGLGVLGDIGIQPARQGADSAGSQRPAPLRPGRRESGAARRSCRGSGCGQRIQAEARQHAGQRDQGQPDDGGRVVALDASIRAMPRLSALALPAVS